MPIQLPQPLLSATSKAMLHAPGFSKPLFTASLKVLGMPLAARFTDYAMDFEQALKTDQWSEVEKHFAADAVYEVRNMGPTDTRLQGRDAIIAGFRRSLDGFDRKLTRRIKILDGPHERSDQVSFVWEGTYSRAGAPPLVISARQTATYADGLITHLEDDYLPGMGEQAGQWLEEHGEGLDPSYMD